MDARRVLVIEDEGAARDALDHLLREEGFAVRTADCGETGLQSLADFSPDVILCDYYLPDLNGLEVLRRIRESDGSVRFVMITAGLSGKQREQALRTEADAYLTKPIDLDQLHAVLNETSIDSPGVRHATIQKDIRHA